MPLTPRQQHLIAEYAAQERERRRQRRSRWIPIALTLIPAVAALGYVVYETFGRR